MHLANRVSPSWVGDSYVVRHRTMTMFGWLRKINEKLWH